MIVNSFLYINVHELETVQAGDQLLRISCAIW